MDESLFTATDLRELETSITILGKENAYIAQLFSKFYSYKDSIESMKREGRKPRLIEKEFIRIGLAYIDLIERTDPKGYQDNLPYKLEEIKEEIYETVCHSCRLAKLALEFTEAFPQNKLIKIAFKKV